MEETVSRENDPFVYENVKNFDYDPERASEVVDFTWSGAEDYDGEHGEAYELMADNAETMNQAIRNGDYESASKGAIAVVGSLGIAAELQERTEHAASMEEGELYGIIADDLQDTIYDITQEVLVPGLSEVMEETGDLRPQMDIPEDINESWEKVRQQL